MRRLSPPPLPPRTRRAAVTATSNRRVLPSRSLFPWQQWRRPPPNASVMHAIFVTQAARFGSRPPLHHDNTQQRRPSACVRPTVCVVAACCTPGPFAAIRVSVPHFRLPVACRWHSRSACQRFRQLHCRHLCPLCAAGLSSAGCSCAPINFRC